MTTMMRSYLLGALLAFFLCGTSVLAQSLAANPGLRIRANEKALNTIWDLAMDTVFAAGARIPMPNETGSAEFLFSTVDYKITNVQATNFREPGYNVTIRPGRLNLLLSNSGVTILGDWSYKYKLFDISDSGTINATIAVPLINVSLAVAFDPAGRQVLSVADCNSNVSGAAIELGGEFSWLYNLLFSGDVLKFLEGHVQSKICEAAKIVIEVATDAMVAQHPLQLEIENDLLMDVSPLSAPTFGNGFVEVLLNGTVYDKNNPVKPPMTAAPFPAAGESNQSHISIWVSEYILSTHAYAIFKQGILKYSVNPSTVPACMKAFLNTTCPKEANCVGSIVQQLATRFPNSVLEADIVVTNSPVFTISYNGVQGSFTASLAVRARLPDGSTDPVFTAVVNVTSLASLSIEGTRLMVSVTRLQPNVISVANNTNGRIPDDMLSNALDYLAKEYLLPLLREVTKDGFEIPVPKWVQLKNATLSMLNNCLLVATDIAPSH